MRVVTGMLAQATPARWSAVNRDPPRTKSRAYLKLENTMDKETIDSLVRRAVVAELDGCDFLASFDYEELAREYNGIGPE